MAVAVSSRVAGGGETYLYELYAGLQKIGVRATLVGSLPAWEEALGDRIDVGGSAKLTMRKGVVRQAMSSFMPMFRTVRHIRAGHFDAVHVQYMKEKLLLPIFLRNYPILWTEHGPLPGNFPKYGLPLLRWQARRCTIIAVSQAVKESLAEAGIPSIVIPNPIDIMSPRDPSLLDEGSVTVLYAGRLHEYKRVDLLLECAQLRPDWRFTVAGDGPATAMLKAAAGPNVNFVGHLANIGHELNSANVVALTSGRLAREGSPMTMLEARSRSIPTVVMVDSHAATEAAQLGCWIAEPDAVSLCTAIASAAESGIDALDSTIADSRSRERWVVAHQAVLASSRG